VLECSCIYNDKLVPHILSPGRFKCRYCDVERDCYEVQHVPSSGENLNSKRTRQFFSNRPSLEERSILKLQVCLIVEIGYITAKFKFLTRAGITVDAQ
jgi:hypothetical protein